MNKNILLIGFYNEKALGVRYLYRALSESGFTPHIIYFKAFNSLVPQPSTEQELNLLREQVRKIDPLCVCLSVMSSLYLETIDKVSASLRQEFPDLLQVWGGVFPTLEAERALKRADLVLRGEGEDAIVELVTALADGTDPRSIQNIAYLDDSGEYSAVDVRPIADINRFSYPPIGGANISLINDNTLSEGDPQLRAFTYELCASRGCPFTCSYCSSINLRRMYAHKGRYVRFRSVDSVIEELLEAKKKLSRLRVIHFWDEIFSDEPGWVEEFSRRYKNEIKLPFRIWGHPLKTTENQIRHLVDAGLHQIVMGIQSGSENLRRDIFHRLETQEQILQASRVLAECRVPVVYYDFMICHPFESTDQLRETFELCMELSAPFKLNIHGLNFLPSTDIVRMALERGLYTEDELEGMMYGSIQEQYDQYWGPNAAAFRDASLSNVWVSLIYLTQFPKLHGKLRDLSERAVRGEAVSEINALRVKMERAMRRRELIDKVRLVLRVGR